MPPALISVAFVAFWCLISLLISASGWMGLAKRYRTTVPLSGRVFPMEGADIGSRYRGVLFFALLPEGLRMSVLLPFRVGHPPLLVPWQDIRFVEEKKVLFGTVSIFKVGKPYGTTMEVPGTTGRAIAAEVAAHVARAQPHA